VRNGKIHLELLEKFRSSEELDRSNFAWIQSIKISQNLLLQKRARTPNQELLHDKKQFSLWFSQQNTLVAWPWLSLAREEP
jgi:hypothetical protein